MRATIQLGRIAGVRVGMHWSVLAIALLLVFGLGLGQFRELYPGYGDVVYLTAGVAAALLFVLSLLAHEVAHAVVAARAGIEVDGITLWLLGGVARLRGQARTPGVDLRIAAVGPATSVLAGVVFGLATWLAAAAGVDPLAGGVLAYLTVINFVLAAFNLVPALPLDGGRILRSVLWAWWDNRHRATVWSARIGRGFGFVLIFLGVLWVFGGAFSGLWWVLIGLFVVTMATAEERHAELGSALAGLRVRDVMTANPDTADGRQAVGEFLRDVALVRRHSAFPLLDREGRLQGLITLSRLKQVPPERRETTTLKEIGCPAAQVPMVEPDEPLPDLLDRMDGCTDGRALVFDHGRLVGIVSPSDISRAVTLHGLGVNRPASVVEQPPGNLDTPHPRSTHRH